jgi:hypothetical protein
LISKFEVSRVIRVFGWDFVWETKDASEKKFGVWKKRYKTTIAKIRKIKKTKPRKIFFPGGI